MSCFPKFKKLFNPKKAWKSCKTKLKEKLREVLFTHPKKHVRPAKKHHIIRSLLTPPPCHHHHRDQEIVESVQALPAVNGNMRNNINMILYVSPVIHHSLNWNMELLCPLFIISDPENILKTALSLTAHDHTLSVKPGYTKFVKLNSEASIMADQTDTFTFKNLLKISKMNALRRSCDGVSECTKMLWSSFQLQFQSDDVKNHISINLDWFKNIYSDLLMKYKDPDIQINYSEDADNLRHDFQIQNGESIMQSVSNSRNQLDALDSQLSATSEHGKLTLVVAESCAELIPLARNLNLPLNWTIRMLLLLCKIQTWTFGLINLFWKMCSILGFGRSNGATVGSNSENI